MVLMWLLVNSTLMAGHMCFLTKSTIRFSPTTLAETLSCMVVGGTLRCVGLGLSVSNNKYRVREMQFLKYK